MTDHLDAVGIFGPAHACDPHVPSHVGEQVPAGEADFGERSRICTSCGAHFVFTVELGFDEQAELDQAYADDAK